MFTALPPASVCWEKRQANKLRDSWAGPHRHGASQPPWRLYPQVTITFKDLAVRFSEEEWRLLEERQREFYREVMRENYETLVSVGKELLGLPWDRRQQPGVDVGGREARAPSQGAEPPRDPRTRWTLVCHLWDGQCQRLSESSGLGKAVQFLCTPVGFWVQSCGHA